MKTCCTSSSGQTSTKYSNTHTNDEISHEAEQDTLFSFYLIFCLRKFLTWEKFKILVELVQDDPVFSLAAGGNMIYDY